MGRRGAIRIGICKALRGIGCRFALLALVSMLACGGDARTGDGDPSTSAGAHLESGPLIVFNAGSLAPPIRAVLDSFSARTGVEFEQENGGSLETARKLTELEKIPDVILLADQSLFPRLLMPRWSTWYASFARNRMVLAYTETSRYADSIGTDDWYELLQRPDVQTGRSDPDQDPAGYRAILAMRLAELHYETPGLASRLLLAAPERNMRPNEIDLIALLQSGELDYAWEYESLARGAGLPYVILPHQIDLGTPADSALYAKVSVRVAGRTPGDTLLIAGEPILYGLSIPVGAPHPRLAARFVEFMLSKKGRLALKSHDLDVLDQPVLVGSGVPATVATALSSVPQ